MSKEDNFHIEKIKLGNKESFELVFVKYYKNLCKYAYQILKSEDDAQDVVTDVFTNIWDKRNEITINLSLGSYLFRSVYNRSLNVIRNRKNKIQTNQLDANYKNAVLDEKDKNFPLSEIINEEKLDDIKKAINKLPKRCKNIFILHRKYKCKYAEIAELLEISEHTVKAQVQIALQKLRNELMPVKEK